MATAVAELAPTAPAQHASAPPQFDCGTAVHLAAASFAAYLAPSDEQAFPYRDRWADGTTVWFQDGKFCAENLRLLQVTNVEISVLPKARTLAPAIRV